MGIKAEAQASISLRGQTMGSHGHLTSWQMPKQVHCPSAGRECNTSTGTWNNVLILGVWHGRPSSTIAWHQKLRNKKKNLHRVCVVITRGSVMTQTDCWLSKPKLFVCGVIAVCYCYYSQREISDIPKTWQLNHTSQSHRPKKISHNNLNGPYNGISSWVANMAYKKPIADREKCKSFHHKNF